MPDAKAEALIDEILRQRPELTREEVWSMVRRKMSEVGGGYLREVGAVYLVASELGVDLSEIPPPALRLAELKLGLRKVDVRAFYLTKGRESRFTGASGGVGKYTEFYVFDAGVVNRVVIWGEPSYKHVVNMLKLGDAIRLTRVDVRKGRGGQLEIHTGDKSNIDLLPDKPPQGLLESITGSVSEASELLNWPIVVLKGKLATVARERTYERLGSKEQMTTFTLSDAKQQGASIRVVLWGRGPGELSNLGVGSVIRLVGVRIRQGRFGGLEAHGDENTVVEVIDATRPSLKEGMYVLVSCNSLDTDRELVADAILASEEGTLELRAYGDAAKRMTSLSPGTILRLKARIISSSGKARVSSADDIQAVDVREDALKDYKATVKQITEKREGVVVFEGVVVSRPVGREIVKKSGEKVKMTRVLLGDATGEVWLVAWRGQEQRLASLTLGDKVVVFGARIVSREGYKPELEVKSYTSITVKQQRI